MDLVSQLSIRIASIRSRRNEFLHRHAEAFLPGRFLIFQVPIDRDLVGKPVLLHPTSVSLGFCRPLGVVSDGLFQVFCHVPSPVAGMGVAPIEPSS